MFDFDIPALLARPEAMLAGLVLAAVVAGWVVRRLRRSDRPDDSLSNVAMLVGFGWSSEAVWVLTGPGGANLITPIRIGLFTIFEIVLLVFMIRAKRNMQRLGHPGRAGRNAWLVAAGMSTIAVTTAHNVGEGILRLLVPVLLTSMWWDGLVGEGTTRPEWVTSWRWTPRRLLLWIGAIEPGARDVDTVHRERLTNSMVQLEFRRRHGTDRQKQRATSKLSRLSLDADDAIIGEVRARVDRATWFTDVQGQSTAAATRQPVAAGKSVRHRAAWTCRRPRVRTVRTAHPAAPEPAAQNPDPDKRTAQDLEAVVRALDATFPELSQRRIAQLANTTHAKARAAIRRVRAQASTHDPSPRADPIPVPAGA